MLERPPSELERRSWMWVALLTLTLYLGVFVARDVQEFVDVHIGRVAFMIATILVFAIAAAAALKTSLRRASSVFSLIAVTTVYALGAWRLRRDPEEALHLVEYGAVGFLVFRAYSHRIRDPMIYVVAGLLGGILGSLDEIIQYFAPGRVFDFRDMAINVFAVFLMQAGLGFAMRPAFIRPPIRASSVSSACRLTIAWSALLLLCSSNTLARQTWFLEHVPHPAYLDRLNTLMVEYGHRGVLPDGSKFFSRLTMEETRVQDVTNATANAALLDQYTGTNGYRRFHREISRVDYPFAYEARIHLFRRDKYADEAVKLRHRPERALFAATIAFHENTLVEELYPETLAKSSYVLREDWRPIIEALADKSPGYVSPVSDQLFVRFSERRIQVVLISVILAAAGLLAYYRRREQADLS